MPARPGRPGVRSIGGGFEACSPSAPGADWAKSAVASPQQFGSACLSAEAAGAAVRARAQPRMSSRSRFIFRSLLPCRPESMVRATNGTIKAGAPGGLAPNTPASASASDAAEDREQKGAGDEREVGAWLRCLAAPRPTYPRLATSWPLAQHVDDVTPTRPPGRPGDRRSPLSLLHGVSSLLSSSRRRTRRMRSDSCGRVLVRQTSQCFAPHSSPQVASPQSAGPARKSVRLMAPRLTRSSALVGCGPRPKLECRANSHPTPSWGAERLSRPPGRC